jgi:glycosyltransferase involved in cell wall biosynthesis
MSTQPLISIVTPSYNQGHFIEETIRSVIEQDYPAIEHIVMDGGSTDNTVDILRRYEDRIQWRSEKDKGQADAINKGLRVAKGKILAYLNSDDTYLPGAFTKVTQAFREHPHMGMVYGDCYAVNEKGDAYGLIKGRPFNVQRMIQRGEFVPQQAAFWRREAIEKIGLFDESLHFCMDHDFFIRMGRAFPAYYLGEPLANFRFHGTSKSVSAEERHWRESMVVSRRYGLTPWMPWYWIRVARHTGLRVLPQPVEMWIRRRLGRAHDPLMRQKDSDVSISSR